MKWQRTKKLLHLIFWIVVTLIFLYDRQYLLRKISLGNFAVCIIGRLGLIISLAYINLYILVPRYFKHRRYTVYFLLLILTLGVYVTLQNLYDIYLYGFVIGAKSYRNFWYAFPFNFLTTTWYLALTAAFKLSLDWFEQRRNTDHPQSPVDDEDAPPDVTDTVFFKSGTQSIKTDLTAILYVQGLKDYSIIYTAARKIVVKGSLKTMNTRLPPERFMRVHKSYIVARDKIELIEAGKVILQGGKIIPVGRNYKPQFDLR